MWVIEIKYQELSRLHSYICLTAAAHELYESSVDKYFIEIQSYFTQMLFCETLSYIQERNIYFENIYFANFCNT